MATLSVVATPQPSNSPPRVKIDVTDTGAPNITAATVTRTDLSGRTVLVRTNDGNALPLVTSGANRVGTVYDYEMPYGSSVIYQASEQPTNQSGSVTVDSAVAWLVHPGVPDRSVVADFRVGSFDEETRRVTSGVFYPLGRSTPIVISDGRRKTAESSFTLATENATDTANVLALIDDAGVVLLNVPPLLGLGIESTYIFVRDVQVKRRSNIGTEQARDIEMPFLVVDRPAGGTQSQYTWADVVARFLSWQQLMGSSPTWAAVQAPTN